LIGFGSGKRRSLFVDGWKLPGFQFIITGSSDRLQRRETVWLEFPSSLSLSGGKVAQVDAKSV